MINSGVAIRYLMESEYEQRPAEVKKRVDDMVKTMMSNLAMGRSDYEWITDLKAPQIYYSNVDNPSDWIQENPELPKREGLHYITSYKELREGDLILTVDYDYNESVERVKCVDMGVWTEGLVGGEEIFETQEELDEYRWIVLLNRNK